MIIFYCRDIVDVHQNSEEQTLIRTLTDIAESLLETRDILESITNDLAFQVGLYDYEKQHGLVDPVKILKLGSISAALHVIKVEAEVSLKLFEG